MRCRRSRSYGNTPKARKVHIEKVQDAKSLFEKSLGKRAVPKSMDADSLGVLFVEGLHKRL
jgi:hypothetical protein